MSLQTECYPPGFNGVDHGVDFSGRGPVRAVAAGVITRVEPYSSGWLGPRGLRTGTLIVLQLEPHPGEALTGWVYYAENIEVRPGLHVGQRVTAGEDLGLAPGRAPGIESGWAVNPAGESAAYARGIKYTVPPRPTAEGYNYAHWIATRSLPRPGRPATTPASRRIPQRAGPPLAGPPAPAGTTGPALRKPPLPPPGWLHPTGPLGEIGPVATARLAVQVGLGVWDPATMVMIAGAESGWHLLEVNHDRDGTTDYGLFQVNSVHHALFGVHDWRSGPGNTEMALAVYRGQGYRAWATYNNGAYLRYRATAVDAVRQAFGGPAPVLVLPPSPVDVGQPTSSQVDDPSGKIHRAGRTISRTRSVSQEWARALRGL